MTDRTKTMDAASATVLDEPGIAAAQVATDYEMLRLMRQFTRQAGFAGFLIARMSGAGEMRFSERLVLSSWPADLVQRYDRSGAFHMSGLAARLRMTKLPIFGDVSLFAAADAPDADATLGALFADQGFDVVCAMLLHTTAGEPYAFILSGRRAEPVAVELAEIYLDAVRLLDLFERSFPAVQRQSERLSGREIDCLRWAAAGKSTDDIAVILDISAYTVASYFKSAARKLDAVNRMQTIARAIRLKLL